MPARLTDLSEAFTMSQDDLLYAVVSGVSKKIKPTVLLQMARRTQSLINGAFQFWQRGTSSTSAGYVAADRWRNDFVGGTVTQARQSHTIGTLFGVNNPEFFLRQGVTGQTLASHYALTQQRIEGVRSFAGQTVTVLGWAKRNSGTGNMAVEAVQNFGTGGSPSAQVTGTGQAVTLTASWAPFAVQIAVPSITGKTLGTNWDDYLALNFWASAGSDFNTRAASIGVKTCEVDLWGLHVIPGAHDATLASLYVMPQATDELARCRRYYTRLTGGVGSSFGNGHNAAATVAVVGITFPNEMRAAPTALEQSGTAAHYGVGYLATSAVCSAVPVFQSANAFGSVITLTVASGLTAGQGSLGRWENTSGFLAWSAEL